MSGTAPKTHRCSVAGAVEDVVANTALGLSHPLQWSARDVLIDVLDEYVQAQAPGTVFDRVLAPAT